jgi:hypothetical protein
MKFYRKNQNQMNHEKLMQLEYIKKMLLKKS